MKKFLLLMITMMEVFMVASCKNSTDTLTTDQVIDPTTTLDDSSLTSENTSITTISGDNLFSDVSITGDAIENETLIISLIEKEVGNIKKLYNPYKSSSISVDAYFRDSNNNEYYRPGYWTQDYNIRLNTAQTYDTYTFDDELKGTDSASKVGIEHFNVSFKPNVSGTWKYRIEIYIDNTYSEKISGRCCLSRWQ